MLLTEDDFATVERVNRNKERLIAFVGENHLEAVLVFVLLYVATAFFLPGALALTVAGGMLFGTWRTALYADLGATAGAVLAFLAARFVIGEWVQERFGEQLKRFNHEVSQRGHNYLLVLRILPVVPFFAVNYGAGLTRVPLSTFLWTTSVGMLPGALIYGFIGEQLRYVNEPADVFSGKIVLALGLLSLFALFPVLAHHLKGRKGD